MRSFINRSPSGRRSAEAIADPARVLHSNNPVHLIGSLRSEGYSLGHIPGLISLSRHDNESRAASSRWGFLNGHRRHLVHQVQRSGTVTFLKRARRPGSVRVGEDFWLFSTSKSLLSRPRPVASGTPARLASFKCFIFASESYESRELKPVYQSLQFSMPRRYRENLITSLSLDAICRLQILFVEKYIEMFKSMKRWPIGNRAIFSTECTITL